MPAAPMYGRLPIVKMLLVTIALTVVISAVMVPINWDGQVPPRRRRRSTTC